MKKIDTVFIDQINHFGNFMIILNNIIFYCEVIGCHKILLDDRAQNLEWLIKNTIYIQKLNITIMLGSKVYCNNDVVICQNKIYWDLFYPTFIKPQIRLQYIKEEILRNIQKVNIDPNDLYIHIRGGDIFEENPSPVYAQPPLCFYETVINQNKFKSIYIVSMDRKNVILDELINKHKDIIFEQNNYEYDISLLIHSFNLVASVSTFFISSIKFNDNLKNLWEYDIYRLSEKFIQLHHHLYKFDIKYKIYTMKPSNIYADKMFIWTKSESQLKLMLEDSCPYDFVLTKPN